MYRLIWPCPGPAPLISILKCWWVRLNSLSPTYTSDLHLKWNIYLFLNWNEEEVVVMSAIVTPFVERKAYQIKVKQSIIHFMAIVGFFLSVVYLWAPNHFISLVPFLVTVTNILGLINMFHINCSGQFSSSNLLFIQQYSHAYMYIFDLFLYTWS